MFILSIFCFVICSMEGTYRTRQNLGAHITFLYEIAGLTRKNFDGVLKISSPAVATKILKGTKDYYIDYLTKIAFFFGMQLHELTNRNIKLPATFRELLLSYHKFIDSDAYLTLNIRPEYKYAIERILQTRVLNEWVQVGKIALEIQKLLGHSYEPTELSTTLNKYFSTLLLTRESPNNRGHNEYKLKNPHQTENSEVAYIPTYIRLTQHLKKSTSFDVLFIQVEILSRLATNNSIGRSLVRLAKSQTFNTKNVETYISPLINANLINRLEASGKADFMYAITDNGRMVLNL